MGKLTPPLVAVREGTLKGSIKCDIHDENFYSFQGIPYAKPPLGRLRFKAPQPPEIWKGIRDAQEEGPECYAKHFNVFAGSEDCLYLNVFTKDINSSTLKPVMVWIHAGGFTTGSSKVDIYGPEYLMTEDIVLVTFNYRLGPLGFLVLEDLSLGVPGNAALKDMVMVLKWVQRNIKVFSGDPNNVTIFGVSAGGAAVHHIMLSPLSKGLPTHVDKVGLFHKAIAQSGSVFHNWAVAKRHSTRLLAEALEIHSNNEAALLKILQEIPVEELVEAIEKIRDPFYVGHIRPFGPTIEKPSPEAFWYEDPVDIIKSGRYQKVPLITGCSFQEGMFIYALCRNSKSDKLLLKSETIIPFYMHLRKGTTIYQEIENAISKFYFGDKDPYSQRDNICRLYTDNSFLLEVFNTAKYHLETNTAPIYFYHFSIDTSLNFWKHLYGITDPGVCHADDIGYLFKNVFNPTLEPNSKERVAIYRLVKLWTNFARYGNPTPLEDDPLLNVKWEPISNQEFKVLHIGERLTLLNEHPERKTIDFWNQLFERTRITSKL